MSKRFLDTGLFEDPFFMGLKPPYKLLWIYALCNCNHAGIWKVNVMLASMMISAELKEEEALEIFKSKIEVLEGGYWFIPGFLKFQYGLPLNIGVRAIASAYKSLQDFGLHNSYETVGKPFTKGYLTLKDKDKDKDKDKTLKKATDYFKAKYEEKHKERFAAPEHHYMKLAKFLKDNGITVEEWCRRTDNYFADPYVLGHSIYGLMEKWAEMVGQRTKIESKMPDECKKSKTGLHGEWRAPYGEDHLICFYCGFKKPKLKG